MNHYATMNDSSKRYNRARAAAKQNTQKRRKLARPQQLIFYIQPSESHWQRFSQEHFFKFSTSLPQKSKTSLKRVSKTSKANTFDAIANRP